VWYIHAGSTNFNWSDAIASPGLQHTVHIAAGKITDDDGSFLYHRIYLDAGDLVYNFDRVDTLRYYYNTTGVATIGSGITLESQGCIFDGGVIQDDSVGSAYWIDSIGSLGDWVVTYDTSVRINYARFMNRWTTTRFINDRSINDDRTLND
jgi:hypothetical protein